ncbi:copper resistance protein CopC [Conyzicola sp.]|uniref:copper resistance CopC family protein n=1 Tax=Conyzicola sp. TaxID=1969404 RepID=UPI003988FC0B
MAGIRRPIALAAVGATLAVGAVLGFAAPAEAHDAVVSSTPVEGEQLTALPSEFAVTMNTALVDLVGDGTGFGIQVKDASGRFYGDGCLSLVDATMSMPATLGEAGEYTMDWRITSSDSHPVGGTIAFSWAPPADATPSAGFAAAPVCGETEEAPEPEMTTQAEAPQDEPSATPTAEAPADDTAGTLLWLGGAALAVVAAIGATLFFVRPKKKTDEPVE